MHRAVLLLALLFAGCGNTALPLAYRPATAPAAAAQPVVALGQVTVTRQTGAENPRWLGTIRGGYGNPIKALEADAPVDQVVRNAFQAALAARGLLAPEGSTPRGFLDIEVREFDANQYARREATAAFVATLRDGAGQPRWSDTIRVHRVEGSVLSLSTGVFGSIEALHDIMQRVMSEAVDQTLDNPGFRAALR